MKNKKIEELMSLKYRNSKEIAVEKNGLVSIHRILNYYSNF